MEKHVLGVLRQHRSHGGRLGRVASLAFAALFAFGAAATSRATPYWIAWEGDDWPEKQGWTRSYGTLNNPGGGQALRTLDDGVLTIDGMQGIGVYDTNSKDLPGALDPDPGEMFMARWRMRVDSVTLPPHGWDPLVAVIADEPWVVHFLYSQDRVWELSQNVEVEIAPGVFHLYELRSTDMRSYMFYVDGDLVLSGHFDPTVLTSRVAWGDGATPAESCTAWDFFEFGVVPEPTALTMAVVASATAGAFRRSGRLRRVRPRRTAFFLPQPADRIGASKDAPYGYGRESSH